MLKAPKFWYIKRDSFLSNVLYPFSLVFRLGTKIRNLISKEKKSKLVFPNKSLTLLFAKKTDN